MKSLAETDQLNSEQFVIDIDQDKGKDGTDFHVSKTLPAEEVPEENATDTHVETENEVRVRHAVQPDTVKINDVVKYKIDD